MMNKYKMEIALNHLRRDAVDGTHECITTGIRNLIGGGGIALREGLLDATGGQASTDSH